jgi:hypothetical protein
MSKPFIRTLATTAFVAAMGAAHAGGNVETVSITATPMRGLFGNEAHALVGQYRMSDGRLLVLSPRGASIKARLDGEPATLLRVARTGELRAADGSMSLAFETGSDGYADRIRLTLERAPAPAQQLASARRSDH